MTSLATALLMRSLNSSVGATVKRCASAFSIWKLRSGILSLAGPLLLFCLLSDDCRDGRSLFQSVEKAANFLPDLGSAGKPAPVAANQAYQFVALVDWEHVVLGSCDSSHVSHPVDQQGFNISCHFLKQRIGVLDVLPRL